ncbi:hypothetical protein TSOC_008315 [Tetrabaena socialis]|uniref:Uncharacterized protein n=1 Tax=Tetrabaena socialis TaxID=47790 RepID=A0A2J7ZYT9_9CHLO|nr:hypothetical protein TSOC_008315 [Tetrabaena socialis]|eukprot:PNH05434.1 hypothetical protein TSOC_008315 [Tetrabaena socialis]
MPMSGKLVVLAEGRRGDALESMLYSLRFAPGQPLPDDLVTGEAFLFEAGRLFIRYTELVPPPASDDGGVSGGSASVSLCRYLVTAEGDAEAGCSNGVDDDCDGLTDEEDPDCQGF